MKRQLIVSMCLGLAVCLGCAEKEKPAESGTKIEWPGGSVTIDSDKGVDVQAPGVSVKANKDKGVNVKAPGTEVDVK